ncbi:MAG: 4Fe-4S ferredoxin, partial [Desulfobacteraceae bacterium]
MSDVFRKLAHHLDRLPGGFPATRTGVEIRILKQLFSQEQARIAMALTMLPEPIEAIADRLDLLPEELSVRLDEMSNNGLIFK